MTRFAAESATAPTGVFKADMGLAGVASLLSTLSIGRRGAVFFGDSDGNRLVSPQGDHVAAAGTAADRAVLDLATATTGIPITENTADGRYEVAFAPLHVAGDLGATLAVVVDWADITDGIYRQALIAASVAFAGGLLSIVLGVLLSARISRPVVAIAEDLRSVGEFNISKEAAPRSFVHEISDLGTSVDHMKASLRSFSHYVPADLVRTLLADGREARLGGEIRRLTMHFSDVADFTTISEGLEPRQLVEAMGRYFALMTENADPSRWHRRQIHGRRHHGVLQCSDRGAGPSAARLSGRD